MGRTNSQLSGGAKFDITPTNPTFRYINGNYLVTDFSVDADYEITVKFNTTSYVADMGVIGTNTTGTTSIQLPHLTMYNNKWYAGGGTAEKNFGSYSTGEHTCIINKDNHIYFDGVAVVDYTPVDNNAKLCVGARPSATHPYNQELLQFTIKSISTGQTLYNLVPLLLRNNPTNASAFIDTVTNTIYSLEQGITE